MVGSTLIVKLLWKSNDFFECKLRIFVFSRSRLLCYKAFKIYEKFKKAIFSFIVCIFLNVIRSEFKLNHKHLILSQSITYNFFFQNSSGSEPRSRSATPDSLDSLPSGGSGSPPAEWADTVTPPDFV